MNSHKEHIYKHKQYIQSIKMEDSDLPGDHRKIPYPAMRKWKIIAKTWGEYYSKRLDLYQKAWKNHMEKHAALVFNNSFGVVSE